MKYIDCTLTIRDNKNIEYVDHYKRDALGEIRIDDLTLKTIKRLKHWVDRDEHCNRQDLEILGEQLYNLIFSTVNPEKKMTVREAFERTFDVFEEEKQKGSDQRLRLFLVFHKEAVDWASYPWEFLFMPRNAEGFFLAEKKTDLILTRFVPEVVIKDRKPDLPLKILIAFSHPRDLPRIVVDDFIKAMEALKSKDIDVKLLENPSQSQLKNEMDEDGFKPDILHFIGHGKPGFIALNKEEEQLKVERKLKKSNEEVKDYFWIDNKTVVELFRVHHPYFVFLHACKGAEQDSWDSFKDTARELVHSKIPVVVAMQYEISENDASIFAIKFYQQISIGKCIDEAVSEARYALGTIVGRQAWDDRSFGTPVVYLQSGSETPLFEPRKQDGEIEDTVRCPYFYYPPPDNCTGSVPKKLSPRDKACSACGREIMECPACHQVMAKKRGFCSCGYKLSEIPAREDSKQIDRTKDKEYELGAKGAGLTQPQNGMLKQPSTSEKSAKSR